MIESNTNTELDPMVSGKYAYEKHYHGHPAYKRNKNVYSTEHSAQRVDLFLFFHLNRWIITTEVGLVSTTAGEELWGLIRWNGTYRCPENVGREWTYWIYPNKVDEVGQPIDVMCSI